MCNIIRQTASKKILNERFNADFLTADVSFQNEHYVGFQHVETPVITNQQPNVIQLFKWGLIREHNFNTLNARIETLKEKPSFKNYTHQKCLVLVTGFYEWQHLDDGNIKKKYLLSLPNDEPFALAGLWNKWENQLGEPYGSYTIITTEAKGIMREIHNSALRMPVILKKEIEMDWLMGKTTAKLFTDLIATPV